MLSVGFGENGAVTFASGSLAVPQRGGDYPTDRRSRGSGAVEDPDRTSTSASAAGRGTTRSRDRFDVAEHRSGARARRCPGDRPVRARTLPTPIVAPVDAEPITVTLISVEPDLTMVWAADNTIWLLPAYSFGFGRRRHLHRDRGRRRLHPTARPGSRRPPSRSPSPHLTRRCPPPTSPRPAPRSPRSRPRAPRRADRRRRGRLLPSIAAQELAETFGYEVRVVRQDGVDLAVTADFSESRINVAVDNGAVTEVISIG